MFKMTRTANMDYLNDMIEWVLKKISVYMTLSKKQGNELRIVCEEILVNIILYAYQETDEKGNMTVELDFDEETGRLTLLFTDGGIAFNPLEAEEPDLAADIMERPIGGLGIFMVKNIADSIEYERLGNQNRLTVRKTYQVGGESEKS